MNVAPGLAMTALVVVAIAAWSDVRMRRIPNLLVLLALLTGLALQGVLRGGEGLWSSLGGMVVGGGLLLPAYALRFMGAGDVKLMAAVGACLGLPTTVVAVLASTVAGGVIGMGMALSHGVAGRALNGAALLAVRMARPMAHAETIPLGITGLRTPFGVAIAAGTIFALWLRP